MAKTQTLGSGEIHTALDRITAAISARHPSTEKLLLLGIANGGIELARQLSARLMALNPRRAALAGTLDISFHRDDISCNPIPKEFAPTHIPADVNGAIVILVDDVLFSGRTAKAALDELFDHGRPAKVELAVLADRGGRILPVAADYTGLTLSVRDGEKVVIRLDSANPARDTIQVGAPAPRQKSKNK